MLWFVSQNVLLSICIILLAQYIWDYCKTHFTTRKTKHIVDIQTQKYRDIIKEFESTNTKSITNTDFIPEEDQAKMIDELTQFLHMEDGFSGIN
jgi:hypothetical protein